MPRAARGDARNPWTVILSGCAHKACHTARRSEESVPGVSRQTGSLTALDESAWQAEASVPGVPRRILRCDSPLREPSRQPAQNDSGEARAKGVSRQAGSLTALDESAWHAEASVPGVPRRMLRCDSPLREPSRQPAQNDSGEARAKGVSRQAGSLTALDESAWQVEASVPPMLGATGASLAFRRGRWFSRPPELCAAVSMTAAEVIALKVLREAYAHERAQELAELRVIGGRRRLDVVQAEEVGRVGDSLAPEPDQPWQGML